MGAFQRQRHTRQTGSERPTQFPLFVADRVVTPGVPAGSVGRSAAGGFEKRAFTAGDPDQNHAMVEQGQ